MKKWNINSML